MYQKYYLTDFVTKIIHFKIQRILHIYILLYQVQNSQAGVTLRQPSRLLPLTLKREYGIKLQQECAAYNVSLQALFTALASMSLGTLSGPQHIPLAGEIFVSFPIDLRQYQFFADPQPMGMWNGFGLTKVKLHKTLPDRGRFWRAVQDVQEAIDTDSRADEALSPYKLALAAVDKHSTKTAARPLLRAHLEVALLTPKPAGDPEEGARVVQLEEYFYTRSLSAAVPTPVSLGIASYGDKVSCTVSYSAQFVTREFAKLFTDRMLDIVQYMVGLNNGGGAIGTL